MAPKRKTQKSKLNTKDVKKLKENKDFQPDSVIEKVDNLTESTLESDRSLSNSSKSFKDYGCTIVDCFRKQKLEDSKCIKSVKCPICQQNVSYYKINQHLDNNCNTDHHYGTYGISDYGTLSTSDHCNTEVKVGKSTTSDNNCNTEPCNGTNSVSDYGTLSTSSNCNKEVKVVTDEDDGTSTTYIDNNCNTEPCNGTNSVSDYGTLRYGTLFTHDKKVKVVTDDATTEEEHHSISDNPRGYYTGEPQRRGAMSTTHLDVKSTIILNGGNNAGNEEVDVVTKPQISLVCESSLSAIMRTSDNVSDEIKELNTREDTATSIELNKPYYLYNFNLTLKTVLGDTEDKTLFNLADNQIITTFQSLLSDGAKKLYVRLFQRKFKWFQVGKIQYPKISENLQPFLRELLDYGFLQTEKKLTDLQEILQLLSASDIQDIAKTMHIIKKNEGRSKKHLLQLILNHSKKQRSIFTSQVDSIGRAILKKCKALLGSCVKLEIEPRDVFSRVILLFSLNLLSDDDDKAASQLSALFLVNIGKIIYPSYTIYREARIFCNRDELIKYASASENYWKMEDAFENKKFEEAREIFETVKIQFEKALEDLAYGESTLLHCVRLPVHLRRFTCPWLYTRVCSRGVELLQRDKNYEGAVEMLRKLLEQDKFCVSRRGWWWERLALNLDQHLKRPCEAFQVIVDGLADPRVKTGHRFALEQRAKKICESKRNVSLQKRLTEIEFTTLQQPSVVTICGKRLSNEPVFVLNEVNVDGTVDDNIVSFCGVEEMALRYYRQQGYNEGIHGEGLTFNTMFGLLMWHVIYQQDIPDVFRTQFQMAPLDIYSENFYMNRRDGINQRLDEIRNASVETLQDWLEQIWTEQHGKTCVAINWSLFSGLAQIKELVACIGGIVLSGIFTKFAKNYRHTRSGLPDLVVWNSTTKKYKVVEVKGPNDRLSTKQHVWLDVLVTLGVPTEVLYVKAIGGRQL